MIDFDGKRITGWWFQLFFEFSPQNFGEWVETTSFFFS